MAQDFARWDWQIITRSILGARPYAIVQRVCSTNKSNQLELKNPAPTLARRVSSLVFEGKNIAVLAINDVGTPGGAQIAAATDRADLNAAIANARSRANLVVCLVHWGTENSENVTDEQRELARWLIDRGVDLVVGSHPHCVQPLDFYHGCPIAYSLGNLVFDGAPSVSSWNRGALLEIDLDESAEASSVCLIPLVLKDGFPQLMNRSGRLQSSLQEESVQSADFWSREAITP